MQAVGLTTADVSHKGERRPDHNMFGFEITVGKEVNCTSMKRIILTQSYNL